MKSRSELKLIFVNILFWGLVPFSNAQEMKIVLNTVEIRIKDASANGIKGDFRISAGKMSGSQTLFDTDSLKIQARYKLTANNSRRSQTKDSSVKLLIDYSLVYKGRGESRKVEKVFFLDNERAFSGNETFNISMSKYANTVIRLNYSGRLEE